MHCYNYCDFYYVTTTDDQVMEKLEQHGDDMIFATDAILAHLIANTRSVFRWDIVAHCESSMVFFDKRDVSNFDLLELNENATASPTQEDSEHMSHPDRLSLEATMINQSLLKHVLKSGNGTFYKKFDTINPFASEEASAASADGAVVYCPVLRQRATIDQRYLPGLRYQYMPQNVKTKSATIHRFLRRDRVLLRDSATARMASGVVSGSRDHR
ncbi:hypothetical protein BBJ28_00025541 [Nothophytophthora sp. Chile5]|nr:hypothetical protein BBJ28_00025541 [Nothophytophthora sp. Chile5]